MPTLCLLLLLLLVTGNALGQAPGLLWRTNIGAQVFAVDEQTNVYAVVSNAVIQVDRTGAALQTNRFCPLPGLAQRDLAGNFYFAGVYPDGKAVDFGGVTLTNAQCFIAKYAGSGTLLWAKAFAPFGAPYGVAVTDFQTDAAGNCYIGGTWRYSPYTFYAVVGRFDPNGENTWNTQLPTENFVSAGSVRLGLGILTNMYEVVYRTLSAFPPPRATLYKLDSGGTATSVAGWGGGGGAMNLHTIGDRRGAVYNVEYKVEWPNGTQLTKRFESGVIIWAVPSVDTQWTVGMDRFGGVHTTDDAGTLSRYDSEGNFVWSLNLAQSLTAMVLGPQGDRFISLSNGDVARLGSETVAPPAITLSPQSQTVLYGSDVSLTGAATGFTPLRYFWQFNGATIDGATSTSLSLTARPAQAGLYSLVITNIAGSVTSSPALLRVKMVEIYSGSQPLTNGNYSFLTPPLLTIRSAFPNGATFYTLDGSAPNFSSIQYTGPFTLSNSATVRAIGYSADFLQSEAADPVYATVASRHTLTIVPSLGGTVTLNPPGGSYLDTNVVTVTATPTSGWTFLYWLGDASGTSSAISVSMERDKTIKPIFGTTLSTTVVGSGQIDLAPPGGIYPYGTVVRLTGIPQPGNYFGFWGNAASGDQNPLYFTVTNPSPTISSIFGSVPQGQAALTVVIKGAGQVTVTPSATLYNGGANVTLTAVPDSGQSFLNWSGDVTSANNPLLVTLNQSLTVSANFTAAPKLSVTRPGLEGMTPDGLRLTLLSAPQSAWQILGSTNLDFWQTVGNVSNSYGEVQFTDPAALQLPFRFYRAAPGP